MKAKLEDISEPWENVDFFKVLSAERERLNLSIKVKFTPSERPLGSVGSQY